jgi:hypothetical protein
MRRSLLKQRPQIISNNLWFSLQPPIPNAFHHNAVVGQESIPLGVMPLLNWMTVLKTVRLHHHARLGAKEIQSVFSKGMLAAKLVTGESLIAKHSPQGFLCPGRFFAKRSGAGDLWFGWRGDAPHPGPLPFRRGEGDGFAARTRTLGSHIAGSRELDCCVVCHFQSSILHPQTVRR